MKDFGKFARLAAAAVLFGAGSAAGIAGDLSLSNKWRIEVSEGANSDGVIHFRVTPDGGQPTDVEIPIKDGRGENGVASDIRDGLRKGLDKERYHIETDDGEDVLVKKRKGPNFELKLVSSTVKSVRFDIEKE
jgi:hypothetical protein